MLGVSQLIPMLDKKLCTSLISYAIRTLFFVLITLLLWKRNLAPYYLITFYSFFFLAGFINITGGLCCAYQIIRVCEISKIKKLLSFVVLLVVSLSIVTSYSILLLIVSLSEVTARQPSKNILEALQRCPSKDYRIEEVEHFISENPNSVKFINKNGDGVIHLAIKYQSLKTIQLLVNHGASVNNKNNDGNTPLHEAMGSTSAVSDFIDKYRPKINVVNNEGNTPLHIATERGHLELILLLLKNGANLELRNKDNMSAYDIAQSKYKYYLSNSEFPKMIKTEYVNNYSKCMSLLKKK